MAPKPTPQPWNVLPPRGEPIDRHYEQAPASRTAYAACHLSFNPQGARFHFWPGDLVSDVLPGDVVEACLMDGRATTERPSRDALLAALRRDRDAITRSGTSAGRQLAAIDKRIGELEAG